MTKPARPFPSNRLAARDTGWRWWYALAGYAGFILAGTLPMLLAAGDAVAGSLLAMVALGVLPLAMVVALARRVPGRASLGLDTTHLARHLAIAFAAVVLFNLAMVLLPLIAPGRFGGVGGNELRDSGFGAGAASDLVVVLCVAILAPIVEELAFRVAIFRPLHDGLRNWRPAASDWPRVAVSVVVSALIFTLPHATPSEPSFIPYLMISALFPLIYVLTGSLVAVIMAHAFQSCYAWAALILTRPEGVELSPLALPLVLAAPLIVLAMVLALARIWRR